MKCCTAISRAAATKGSGCGSPTSKIEEETEAIFEHLFDMSCVNVCVCVFAFSTCHYVHLPDGAHSTEGICCISLAAF